MMHFLLAAHAEVTMKIYSKIMFIMTDSALHFYDHLFLLNTKEIYRDGRTLLDLCFTLLIKRILKWYMLQCDSSCAHLPQGCRG